MTTMVVTVPLTPDMLAERRAHLRAMLLLLRFPEGRSVPLALNSLLSMSEKDGGKNNSHGRGEGEDTMAAAAGPYRLFLAPACSSI